MKIEAIRVPQYMDKNVSVIMVDGKPICTCREAETTAITTAILEGHPMDVPFFDTTGTAGSDSVCSFFNRNLYAGPPEKDRLTKLHHTFFSLTCQGNK